MKSPDKAGGVNAVSAESGESLITSRSREIIPRSLGR